MIHEFDPNRRKKPSPWAQGNARGRAKGPQRRRRKLTFGELLIAGCLLAFSAPFVVDHMGGVRAIASPGECRIKGNISENGRIYHLPHHQYYHRTRIDMMRGERWFCSEAEARAAGWRSARR